MENISDSSISDTEDEETESKKMKTEKQGVKKNSKISLLKSFSKEKELFSPTNASTNTINNDNVKQKNVDDFCSFSSSSCSFNFPSSS